MDLATWFGARRESRRELVPVRRTSFDPRVLRKRPLAALSDPARARVLRKRGAAAQAALHFLQPGLFFGGKRNQADNILNNILN